MSSIERPVRWGATSEGARVVMSCIIDSSIERHTGRKEGKKEGGRGGKEEGRKESVP